MAASQIKILLDELASILAEMGALEDGATDQLTGDGSAEVVVDGGTEPTAEAVMENAEKMESLIKRADQIKAKIAFYERAAEKEKELRAVLERAAPAAAPASAARQAAEVSVPAPAIAPVRFTGRLRAFKGHGAEERAYRAGMWYKGYVFGDADARRWCRDHGVQSRALSEGVQGAASNLVADEVLDSVIKLVEDYGTFPAYSRTVPMSSDVLIQPRRTGGVVAEFVGENTTIPDSDPAWDKVTLVAKKLVTSTRCSSEFLEDSIINLADYITDEFARAIALKVDICGWVADGENANGNMVGVASEIAKVGHEASVYTSPTAESFEEITIDDFTALLAKTPLYAQRNAAWYISPAGFAASMQRLALSAGASGLSGGNTASDVATGLGLQFLGFPVRLVHVLDGTLGVDNGKIKVLFGDLGLATMYGVRRAMSVRTSTERYAELDQTLMLATTRFAALTHDVGTTSVAGPVVALKTA